MSSGVFGSIHQNIQLVILGVLRDDAQGRIGGQQDAGGEGPVGRRIHGCNGSQLKQVEAGIHDGPPPGSNCKLYFRQMWPPECRRR